MPESAGFTLLHSWCVTYGPPRDDPQISPLPGPPRTAVIAARGRSDAEPTQRRERLGGLFMRTRMVMALLMAAGLCIGGARVPSAACVGGSPNNVLEPGEACDDGNNADCSDTCHNDCTLRFLCNFGAGQPDG